MTHKKSRFFAVPQETHMTSAGEARFPILYYDATALQTFFWCDVGAAQFFLNGTGLAATRFFNGKALAAMGWYEYRDTDIGPYHEVGLAIAVQPSHRPLRWPFLQFLVPSQRRVLGFYIIDLPVTTEIACAAGQEMWGFPKFVTEIPYSIDGNHVAINVLHPESGESIVKIEGQLGG
ncbi:MAG: hypothetical protein D6814_17300, partial [Calditrichaeota bacterium]